MNYSTQFKAYLQGKDFSESTQSTYSRNVGLFLKWTPTEEIQTTKSDILNYLKYLKEVRKQQNHSRKIHLQALKLYFTCLYKNEFISKNPCLLLKIRGTKRKALHRTFTAEQLTQIVDNYYTHYIQNQIEPSLSKQRNVSILSILINQGTTTREVDTIQIEDLDLIKATLKIRGGRRSNNRAIPLKAEQIGMLMYYTQNTRKQLINLSAIESNKLFLPLPEHFNKPTTTDNLMNTFRDLTKQVKTIEPSFTNFKQTRASVITIWLKTVGLRKTQYFAGHRSISSTEDYQLNNLDSLTDDIKKIHPYQ
jgi:site-specific recombinase XerD